MPDWITNTPWWVIAGLVIASGGVLFRISRWTGRVDSKLDAVDGRFDAVNNRFDAVDNRLDAVDNRLDTVDNRLDKLDDTVAKVQETLKRILERLAPPPAVGGRSPIQLTDFGRELSATGSAAEWARTHAPDLQAEAVGKEEFEVFDMCVSYVENLFGSDADFQRRVKATAYQHGTEHAQVLKVYQVELRDILLRNLPPGE